MVYMTVLTVVFGGLCLFSGVHVTKDPLPMHLLEFTFTLFLNMIFLFGVMRRAVEEEMSCLVAMPVWISALVYGIFLVAVRLAFRNSPMTEWSVSIELSFFQPTGMSFLWACVLMVSGFLVQFTTFKLVSRLKFTDMLWPYLAYVVAVSSFDFLINFFIYIANYSMRAFGAP